MEILPLLVLDPASPALLPGERRRIRIETESMAAAVRAASRRGGRLAVVAFDPAQRREDEAPAAEAERWLPVATGCRLLRVEEELVVVRGEARLEVMGPAPASCCGEPVEADDEGVAFRCRRLDPPPASSGSEAAWERLGELLRALDLQPRLRADDPEGRIDRLARWMALPAWVQGEVLCASELETRIRRLADAARELAAPGASFRPSDLDLPYRNDEEYLDDLIRDFEWRARAGQAAGEAEENRAEALVKGEAIRRRRRAATLRLRAGRARRTRRLAATAAAGELPLLERIRREHGLGEADVDALLVAGLTGSDRFGPRLARAARLLPPGEMPMQAWIAALELGAFSAAESPASGSPARSAGSAILPRS